MPYSEGFAITVDGVAVAPLRDTLRIRRSLSEGASLTMTVRGDKADLSIPRSAPVEATDTESGELVFSGHVLRAKVTARAGDGSLIDIRVQAAGIEQQLYRRILTAENARDVNNAADADAQLTELADIAGDDYSAGTIPSDVSRLVGVQPGASVGELLRGMGDAQHVNPDGEIDIVLRSGLTSAATLERSHVLPSSDYTVDVDTTVRRVIAHGAEVRFIASATLERVTEDGVTRSVAEVDPPAGNFVRDVSRVIARDNLSGKFAFGDELAGTWDRDKVRFEWSGALDSGQSASVQVHGILQGEETAESDDAVALSADVNINVPATSRTAIQAAADRELEIQRRPVELMTLNAVFGIDDGLPVIGLAEAVQIEEELQEELDVYQPEESDLWLVHGTALTQPSPTQGAWTLELSRRLPDFRSRDFWGGPQVAGDTSRQIVVGVAQVAGGPPEIALVIPDQEVRVGMPETLDLGTYFSDPDGDTLTYEAVSSNTAAATVSVSGSTLTITGLADGDTTITVTASDASRSAVQIFGAAIVTNRAPTASATIPAQTVAARYDDQPRGLLLRPGRGHADLHGGIQQFDEHGNGVVRFHADADGGRRESGRGHDHRHGDRPRHGLSVGRTGRSPRPRQGASWSISISGNPTDRARYGGNTETFDMFRDQDGKRGERGPVRARQCKDPRLACIRLDPAK